MRGCQHPSARDEPALITAGLASQGGGGRTAGPKPGQVPAPRGGRIALPCEGARRVLRRPG